MTGSSPTVPPRVSVVIPTYNRAHLVGRAIESALSQTIVAQCEVIVVDDGGADQTPEVVRAFGDRLRLIRRDNGGLAAARNTGIAAARGEFVALLDDDDAWTSGKLEKQLAAMERWPQAVLCTTRTLNVDRDGRRQLRPIADIACDEPVDCLPELLRWNFIPPSSVMVRRQAILAAGGFDEALRQAEDYDLWAKLAACGPFVCLSEPLTLYAAATPGSLSAGTIRQLQFELQARQRMRNLAKRSARCAAEWRRGWLRCLSDLRDTAHRRREFRTAACAALRLAFSDPLGRRRWEWRRLAEDVVGVVAFKRPAAAPAPPTAADAIHRSAT
ncbi:MAG: glycosyltransferase family 2 protein [Planctomycetes bacterium]|nr:glycosyltransferase family 2 protein [Planctomycetota bacterium]